jgi:AcrR family transcriptional regulator
MARSGEESRTALLDAAEELFAVHGIETASLRDISIAAGQRNNSAAQYHFVDRAGLVAAVFTRRMNDINEHRLQMIADIDAQGVQRDVPALVAALMVPLIEYVTSHEGWYGRFLLRTQFDQFAKLVKNPLPVSVPVIEITHRLSEILKELPSRIRRARIEQMMTHYIGVVADWEWARDQGSTRLSPAELVDDVLATCCGILLAPTQVELNTLISKNSSLKETQ